MKIIILSSGLNDVVKGLVNSGNNILSIVDVLHRKGKTKINYNNTFVQFVAYCLSKITKRLANAMFLFSKEKKIPYRILKRGNEEYIANYIKKFNADLLIVYSIPMLIKEDIYNSTRLGAINLHPSLLPDYRGPNPYFWMYYDCVNKGGVTVHRINEGEDTGDIIVQEEFDICFGEDILTLQRRVINKLGIKLLLRSIELLGTEDFEGIKQPSKSPTRRARNLKNTDVDKLIDWKNWDVEKVWHILKGGQNSIKYLVKIPDLYKNTRFFVLGYKRVDTNDSPGMFRNNIEQPYIVCKNGLIYCRLE